MRRSPRLRTASPELSQTVYQLLDLYALAAGAAGVGILALAPVAQAEIVYTPAHILIHRGWPGITPLDLNHDRTTDFEFKNWWITNSLGPEGFLSVIPTQQENGIWAREEYSGFIHYAYALPGGLLVGPRRPFFFGTVNFWMAVSNVSSFGCYGPWTDVNNRYLGLKFVLGGETHFGWARLSERCNPEDLRISALLTGYAYETVANKPIVTGKTKYAAEEMGSVAPDNPVSPRVPTSQPGTLGRLAAGSAALSSWRR